MNPSLTDTAIEWANLQRRYRHLRLEDLHFDDYNKTVTMPLPTFQFLLELKKVS